MTEYVSHHNLDPSRIEIAGSLQAVLGDIPNREYSLDLQQQEALEAIGEALITGTDSGYIDMATSTGKTTVEALLAEAAAKAGKRVLLLAPTVEIAKQIQGDVHGKQTGLEKFAELSDTIHVQANYGKKHGSSDADIVVSTYAGIVSDAKNGHRGLGEFDVVIADECHRSLGEVTSDTLRTMMPRAFKLGLSATPDYAADRRSEEVFSSLLYEYSLTEAIEHGRTAPVRALIYETDESLYLSDPQREYTDKELAPLIENASRNGTAVKLAEAFVNDGRQGVIACIPGGKNLHARLMADLLKQNGISATDIGSHLDAETIERRLRAYHAGAIDVLTFTRSLEEGWDSHATSFAINLAPTTSPVRTTQLLGRILRKKSDDLDSIFVDFIDVTKGRNNKAQYTALHALGMEYVEQERLLGRPSDTHSETWDRTVKMLRTLSPKLLQRLRRSQGRLLSEVTVTQATVDPLFAKYDAMLAKEGLGSELPDNDILPANLVARYKKARQEYLDEHGHEPHVLEIIEHLASEGLARDRAKALTEYALRVGVDSSEFRDVLTASQETSDPHTKVEREMLQQAIKAATDTLSEREARIIELYHGLTGEEPKDFNEIAKLPGMDITGARVQQIYSKAMSKMRHPSRVKSLAEFYDPDIKPVHKNSISMFVENASKALSTIVSDHKGGPAAAINKVVRNPRAIVDVLEVAAANADVPLGEAASHLKTLFEYRRDRLLFRDMVTVNGKEFERKTNSDGRSYLVEPSPLRESYLEYYRTIISILDRYLVL